MKITIIILIQILLLLFWGTQLLKLMRMETSAFSSKEDKIIWAAILIFLNVFGALLFLFRFSTVNAKSEAKPFTISAEQDEAEISYPQIVSEISEIRPDMTLCIKEASQYQQVDPHRFAILIKNYEQKSNEWILNKLSKPKSTFRSAYGLIVIEAHNRGLDLKEISTSTIPDQLPKQ